MKETLSPIPGLEETTPHLTWLRPYVRQCGDSPRGKWQMGRRKLLDYLLVYIEKGRGRFTVGNNGYDALPGDLFWIPPDTVHTMEGTGHLMICPFIHFDLIYRYPHSHWEFTIPSGTVDLKDYARLAHPEIPASPISPLSGRYRFYNHRAIGNLIHEICREAVSARPAHTLYLSGAMMQILAEFLKGLNGPADGDDRYTPVMEGAAGFIRDNLDAPLTIRELAENAGLSEAWFRRLFAERFGTSPSLYIRQLRIARARELMTYTEYTLTEISGRCGFATVHSLSRAFRQVEGMCPREYRKFGRSLVFSTSREKSYPG